MDYSYTGYGQATGRPVPQQQQQPGMLPPQVPQGAIPQGQFVPMGGRGVPVPRGRGGFAPRGRGVGYIPPQQARPQPPPPPRPQQPLLRPPRLAPARPVVGHDHPEYRRKIAVSIVAKEQEEDNKRRDAMRQDLGLPSPTYASDSASSIYAASSANSSNVSLLSFHTHPANPSANPASLPFRAHPANPAYDQNRIRQEFLQKNRAEERLERILESMPDSVAARAEDRAPLASPRPIRPRPQSAYEMSQPPARRPITDVAQPGDSQFLSRPGTAVSVASLPEIVGMQIYELGGQPRRYTLPSSGPAAPAALTEKPPPPPPPPFQPCQDPSEGAFIYKGPVGPWFPGMTDVNEPATPISPKSYRKGPAVVELEGITRSREGAHCMTDDISHNYTVGYRHGYSSELERPCLSDDLAPGGFLGDEKGRLPDGLVDSFATACLSDDLALVSDVLEGDDPRRCV